MVDRSQDWLVQAQRDLEQAKDLQYQVDIQTGTQAALPSSIMDNCKATRRSDMPVRSLNSSVFKWPDRDSIHQALTNWANRLAADSPKLLGVGYFGSYARGDWGVNSDSGDPSRSCLGLSTVID